MQVIINADDLGSSIKNKIYNKCSFGIHLNLTDFKPLKKSNIFYEKKLIDENGFFTGNIRNIKIDKFTQKAIYLELEEQIIKLLDLNINISHIDSHHHIHTIPSLFFIIKKLQNKFNIKKVRKTMNYYNGNYSPNIKLKFSKKIWNLLLHYDNQTITTDYFTFSKYLIDDLQNKKYNLSHKKNIFELMCHPGADIYQEETNLLYTDWLDENNVSLISYKDLGEVNG